MSLRERIKLAIEVAAPEHWTEGPNPMREQRLATFARALLPRVLTELERLEAQLAEVTAERDALSRRLTEYAAFHSDYERDDDPASTHATARCSGPCTTPRDW